MRLVLSLAIVPLLASLSGCGRRDAGGSAPPPEGSVQTEGFFALKPSAAFKGKSVKVCWEDTTGFATERALVESAVAHTWGAVDGGAHLRFEGWGACATTTPDSVRIQINRARSYVHAFGKPLLGKVHGVTLDFTFGTEYAPGCAASEKIRKSCIVVDAIHEFGHVLGFSHEQNRTDRTGCTKDQIAAGLDDAPVTAEAVESASFDQKSVMNYCNPVYWDRHKTQYATWDDSHFWSLSSGDMEGLRKLYPSAAP